MTLTVSGFASVGTSAFSRLSPWQFKLAEQVRVDTKLTKHEPSQYIEMPQ
jgi:hypothetical protein